tara:strand:+ start:717 stop:1253 length:537 start_codon:yes stop_codon:yes gene_type:complete
MRKQTTRELVGEYIDLEIQAEYASDDEILDITDKLDTLKGTIKRKVDGIDYFMVELDRKLHLIDAEVEAIKKEETRLRVRRRATESLKKYFNGVLIPMVVEEVGINGVYETDTARYKLFEAWGPVVVLNEEEVPDDFKRVVMTESIDKKKAREVLTNSSRGTRIPGLHIEKVKRVKRS